ncbi:MAG TPA: pyridoxal 5'-phosphate synthase glutaminase subunit PdxT [Actinomycetota bacterium]|nr:pyridoxal 5'-phosphate synthase glutaminase subunit PdxT [Actinomycetota bacterium]
MKGGVLALQGDFREHARVLAEIGVPPVEVRTPEDLARVDLLVIPGGESTSIGKLAASAGLVEPIRERAAGGMPVLGTCAGMIVMAQRVEGGEPLLSLIDITVRRNAYGRQVDSFEADIDVEGIDDPVRAVFIRAPIVEDVGERVTVLAEHEGHPVVLEQGNLVVASFHPELVGETRLHEYVAGKA